MKKRQIACLAMATVMAGTCFTGCSKNSGRKIEGADKDSTKLVNVMEEVYGMKSYTVTMDMDMDVKAGEEGQKGKVKMVSSVDENNNAKVAINVDADVQGMKVNGDVAVASVVDKNLYVDLSGAYNMAVKEIGADTINQYLSMIGLDDAAVKSMLCVKVPLGDSYDAGKYKMEDMKSFLEPIMDAYAVALTDSKALTAADGTYTIKLEGDNLKAFTEKYKAALDTRLETIYDNALAYVEKVDMAGTSAGIATSISNSVIAGLEKLMGETMPEEQKKEVTDRINKSVDEMKKQIADAKENKADNLKKFRDELEKIQAVENDAAGTGTITVVDDKDGYTVKIAADASAEGAEAKTNGELKVVSGAEKITAPENASEISEIMGKFSGIVPLISSLLGGTGANMDYDFE